MCQSSTEYNFDVTLLLLQSYQQMSLSLRMASSNACWKASSNACWKKIQFKDPNNEAQMELKLREDKK